MVQAVKADIVPLLEHLVAGLQPFAQANGTRLAFRSTAVRLGAIYHPEELMPDLTKLICRTLTYAPQESEIMLEVKGAGEFAIVQIIAYCAELSHAEEIVAEVSTPVAVYKGDGNGACFELHLPLDKKKAVTDAVESVLLTKNKKLVIAPFFKKLGGSLHSYFSNFDNLLKAVSSRSEREGEFLAKVNTVILAHLEQEHFDINALARSMAMSRSQLYRRLHPLIRQAPAHYIQFVRLQKAKELLDNTNLSIGEIAFKIGFLSQSHFTRAFKALFGFNPSDLRRSKTREDRPTPALSPAYAEDI